MIRLSEGSRAMKKTRGLPVADRQAAALVIIAIVLVVLVGFVALAIDLGYVALTKTSMQAAADAAVLSGGTELKSNLGRNPVPASTMRVAATALAVDYASRHANGDVSSTYLSPDDDVKFGWAKFNTGTGAWDLHWGSELPSVGGHNLIGVIVHRDREGSENADQPLPLIFASVLGSDFSNLQTKASAVIMPANGIRITPGSDESAEAMPFVISQDLWQKYLRAQLYYEGDPDMFSEMTAEEIEGIEDELSDEPLFGHYYEENDGSLVFRQDFADQYDCDCGFQDPESTVEASGELYSDGVLEVDVYPRDNYTAGNFGTIDVGSESNSTADIERQILHGVNATDLSFFPNNQLVLPYTLQGDTGVSVGMKDELEDVLGQCRAVFLFDGLSNPGNTSQFHVVGMAGVRVMHVQLTGNLEFKHLAMQLCEATVSGAIGDLDEQIDEGTTVFTPLILVE